jgi:Skp family chaperone for outer membrane proteins
MKTMTKLALVAGSLLVLPAQGALAQAAKPAAAPAPAPASTGVIVNGIAIASLEAVVANADAVRAANQQRPTTYKAQIDALEARRNALAAQLKPMYDKLEADSKAAKPDQAALQAQATAIRSLEEKGQAELNNLAQPVVYSQAYVSEQVEGKLDQAVRNAMNARKISLVLNPSAIVALNGNAYNLNPVVLTELNKLIPTAQLVPPQGWEPRQIREARAQQAQQQGAAQPAAPAAKPATPAGPQPDGR